MDTIAGRLRIALSWTGARWQAETRSSRPVTASQVFTGKTLAEAARQIPLLYSLCATAQAQAFASAAEQILGTTPDAATQNIRQQLLRAEMVKEHLWRLLLDWPPLLGQPRQDASMARAMQAYQQFRAQLRASGDPFTLGARVQRSPEAPPVPSDPPPTALHSVQHSIEHSAQHPARHPTQHSARRDLITVAEQASLGNPAADWLTRCQTPDSWQRWLDDSQAPAARLAQAIIEQGVAQLGQARSHFLTLPDLAVIEQQLSGPDAETFIAAPSIHGRCHETTPLARMAEHPLIADLTRTHGTGLLTRFAALLAELARTLADLTTPGTATAPLAQTYRATPNTCIAAVPAARGLLVHRLVAHAGRVEQHQVLAPTEWNFHPQGSLAQALTSLPAITRPGDAAEAERRARLLVTAIDPCVDYAIVMETPS